MTTVQEKLQALERESRKLDPAPPERLRLREAANAYTEELLASLDRQPAYRPGFGNPAGALAQPFSEAATAVEDVFSVLDAEVVTPGLNPASPRSFGYIPGGGLYPSALGDFIADITNRYAGVFFTAPGAVRLEMQLVKWLAEIGRAHV